MAQLNPYADNNTNKVAPTATKALVRNPAIRARYWRSNPMTVPRPIPATRRAGSPARAGPKERARWYVRPGRATLSPVTSIACDVVTGAIDGRRRLIQRWNGIGESPTDNHLIGRN